MPDVQIFSPKKVSAPSTYELPKSAEFVLKCVNADFDGSSAAGDYLPCVTIVSDAGEVIARAVSQDVKVTAGDDAEVSWFRGVKARAADRFGPRCTLLGAGNGTDTLTITLTKAVPRDGVLHVVFTQATIGDDTDTASAPDNVFDSNAVAGWIWATAVDPIIGLVRESVTGSGPLTTSQVGGVARPCTANDLGIGSTVTVHFTTTAPGLFHTAGLVICQRSYFTTIEQFGGPTYGNSDDHPTIAPSLTRLSWDDDYGPGTLTADRDAVFISAMGAYPAVAGFAPFAGTKIGELATGSVSIAAACKEVPEFETFDPGGTWPAGAIQLMGNYQMVEPRTFS